MEPIQTNGSSSFKAIKSRLSTDLIERDVRTTPEKNLWSGVLYQLVYDFRRALRGARRTKETFNYYNAKEMWHQANSEWIQFVCSTVDIDHKMLIDYMRDEASLYGIYLK